MADLTVTQGAISQSAGISNFAAGSFSTGAGDAIDVDSQHRFLVLLVASVEKTSFFIGCSVFYRDYLLQ